MHGESERVAKATSGERVGRLAGVSRSERRFCFRPPRDQSGRVARPGTDCWCASIAGAPSRTGRLLLVSMKQPGGRSARRSHPLES